MYITDKGLKGLGNTGTYILSHSFMFKITA